MAVTKAVFTEGSVLRHVVFMTGTSATSLLSIFLIEVLTVVYIAMLRDDSLLAAFAVAKTLMFFLIAMILGIAVAVSTAVSRSLGSGVPDQARRLASSGLLLGIIAAVCGAALELIVLDPAIRMLGGEGDSFTAAREYLWLTLPASVLVAVELLCVQILRSAGFGKQAMCILLISTAAVAIADPLLIVVFDLGLVGAGIAYLISSLVSAFLGFYYVHRVARLTCRVSLTYLSGDIIDIGRTAIPAVVGNLATPVGMAYVMAAMAPFGSQALAAIGAIDRVIQVAFCVVFALPGALIPILGQNLGAMNTARVSQAVKTTYGLLICYGAATSLLLILLAEPLARLFYVSGEGLAVFSAFCRWGGFFWTLIGLQFIATSIFISVGRPVYVTLFGWLRASLGTVPFVWYGAQAFGSVGVMLGQLLGNTIVAFCACWLAYRVMKKVLSSEVIGIRN
ncbi:MATE family efflux transporter [Pseudomonas cannabina]|uniref:Multidrug transporter MatE n=1 Tax=Pseudomonas syringae pv. maculicola str. ES4326 TaxID=629265 RepID=A0A8T8C8Y1_PSEYM|nr:MULTISPECIES: MATE family efflux transporter [Pseudomonas syringae group]KPB72614.1 MATE efflux family protein [Pseudomonas syringae pv. maculicola]QHE99673.1 multidrug transporter MatE [Pseudomonas syringae pv. maculicola str. ES4326]QQN21715.1 multidrug transporter MatE [Pseudomonas cannabina pv. alisalensis]UBY95383.1 multidrug transporter MatE [Pseudomonas cannabina pv. alisalensis]